MSASVVWGYVVLGLLTAIVEAFRQTEEPDTDAAVVAITVAWLAWPAIWAMRAAEHLREWTVQLVDWWETR